MLAHVHVLNFRFRPPDFDFDLHSEAQTSKLNVEGLDDHLHSVVVHDSVTL